MLQFFLWYLLITLVGWLTFPLAFHLFPALAERGFSLSRPLGLLVWGYVFWMMASLGLIQNDGGGLLLALVVLVLVLLMLTFALNFTAIMIRARIRKRLREGR